MAEALVNPISDESIAGRIDQLSADIHRWCVYQGFHDRCWHCTGTGSTEKQKPCAICKGRYSHPGDRDKNFPRMSMLAVSEIAEAVEAHRCKEGSHRIAEELADAVIRLLDTGYAMGLNIGQAIYDKMQVNAARPHKHGKLY